MDLKVLKKSTQLNLSVAEPILHDQAENFLWSQKFGIINNTKLPVIIGKSPIRKLKEKNKIFNRKQFV